MHISNIPNIAYSTDAVGGYDFEVELYAKDSEELFTIIESLKQDFPGIIRDYSFIEYINEHKVSYYPEEI